MNIRKFSFITCLITAVFLFIAGASMLDSINEGIKNPEKPRMAIIKDIIGNTDPINVLLMVGDKSGDRTDTMMIVNYNPRTAKINLLTIPRDIKVDIKTSIPKITSAFALGGADKSRQVVEDLLNVKIDYYVYFDIKGFRNIIDTLGGVYFDIPFDMKWRDDLQDLLINLKKGYQLLDGDKAEQLLRFRKPQGGRYTEEMKKYYDGSDLKRTNMQVAFIKELIRQKATISNMAKINKILTEMFDNLETDMTLSTALQMTESLGKINADNIRNFRVSGYDKRINKIDYLIFDEKILDPNAGEKFDYSEIIRDYFSHTQSTTN